MRLIAFACLLPVNLLAQPSVAPGDLCSIEGRVVNGLTGEPLKKVILSLYSVDPPQSIAIRTTFTTVSGADGTFAMKDIEAGSYSLSAERSGFLRTSYGARTQNQRGATLRLTQGQKMKDVNFGLSPHGVVSGRVLDVDGDPVQGAQIRLLRLSYRGGHKEFVPVRAYPGVGTDDLGQYRIFGLQPGKYVLAASYRTAIGTSVDRSAQARDNENYLPTYYPSAAEPNSAIQFDIEAGADVRGIDVRLMKMHAVSVSGHIINNAMSGRHQMFVSLVPDKAERVAFGAPSYPADASGRFVMRGVVPGSYRLRASVSENDTYYWADQPLQVRDEDIDNVSVTVSRGVPLTVHARTESANTIDWERVSFSLFSQNRDGGYIGPIKREDQTFHWESVTSGRYNLSANVPDGYYIKAARSGDLDVLASGLEVGSDPIPPLDVVLSSNPGLITGVVQNPDTRQPAPFSSVTLVPQEKERRDQEWYYKTVTADGSGAFTFKNVAPGEYRVYAWDEIEDGAYMDPDFLKPYQAKSESISVKEADRLTQPVTLISAVPSAVAATVHSQ